MILNFQLIIFLFSLFSSPVVPPRMDNPIDKNCMFKGKKMYGKIKFVENFPDIKIKVVENFPDLNIKLVENFPDECGKWEIVDNFPDLKVQIVENFPDIRVKFVDNFPGLP
jgi:hypothetical protein